MYSARAANFPQTRFPMWALFLIALPLLVGVGVDDGIFLVTIARALRGRRGRKVHQDAPYEEAAASDSGDDHDALVTRLSAGCHAIAMTSLTTMLTFGVPAGGGDSSPARIVGRGRIDRRTLPSVPSGTMRSRPTNRSLEGNAGEGARGARR